MSNAELIEEASRHEQSGSYPDECYYCEEAWPYFERQLADALEESQRERFTQVREAEDRELKALRARERFSIECNALRSQLAEVKAAGDNLANHGGCRCGLDFCQAAAATKRWQEVTKEEL